MTHFAVIDCSIKSLAIPCYNRLVQKFDRAFTYHHPPSRNLSTLLHDEKANGYIIFGSYSNVYERLQWQVELSQLMKEKILSNTPVIGICFGHQLMADAFGGKVEPHNPLESYQGLREVNIINNGWGLDKGERIHIAIAHSYQVTEKPSDFIHLGSSNQCYYDILAHKSLPYIGFQGHPEASEFFYKNDMSNIIADEELIKKGQKGGDSLLQKVFKYLES